MIESLGSVLALLIAIGAMVLGIYRSGKDQGREDEQHKRTQERMDNVHTAKQNRQDTASRSDDDVRQRLREGRSTPKK